MVTCASCGAENEAGRKFCGECASPLVLVCPSCGTLSPPSAKFCGECAARLGPVGATVGAGPTSDAPTASRPPGAVAERRLVSVLFADLVGFTTLAEGRDPEETRALLSGYFDLARDVIDRYGGTVEKFIGDAVMAVWGAPTAHEDDAERAVRAGLELVGAVRTLGEGIRARAGILTGEAAVTIGATNQGMVAGDLVNTASRLQSVAAPGTVVVGEATQRAASRSIAFEAAGEHVLKGKAAPVAAWRALRVVAERGGRNRSEALEAPFVGRDDELRLLKDLFHATSREGRARLVSVIGPAGIGKTRLAWEFLKYLDGLVENVWYHDGRSPAYGEGISFWALGEMVRRRAGLLETDDEQTTRAKVAATLEEHVPAPDERRWIEPALLALLGIESATVGSEQLFAAWRTFFERLAASAPVVLAFEDFHFADSGLMDFVDHLMEWSRNVPIYVLTLARPELLDKRPTWGVAKRNFTSLYLEPLTTAAMRELLAALVPGLPAAAARAIVARADGIPLYAVETVRMLVADGKLRLENDRYVPTGDLSELAVPETLTALIASRLDGLAPEDRALVQDAAVLGQSFTLAAVAAVTGRPEADIEQRLRSLVRREVLVLEADPRSPERGQYAFVQALIREVAYNTLARPDRKARHLAAARFFEALGSDELAGALAGHYLAAYRNAVGGADAPTLAAQASVALRGAADRAIRLGSHEHAVAYVEQALSVTEEPTGRAALMLLGGKSATHALEPETAKRLLEGAGQLYAELGDSNAEAQATAALGNILLSTGGVAEAISVLEPAVAGIDPAVYSGTSDAPSEGQIALMSTIARAYAMGDRPDLARTWTDRLLPIAERLDLVDEIASGWLGGMRVLVGRSREALLFVRGALELGTTHDLLDVEGRARTILTFMQVSGDPRAGLAEARTGLDRARRLGSRLYALSMVGNGVDCAFRLGEWDWAVATLREWLDSDMSTSGRIELGSDLIRFLACRGEDTTALVAEIDPLVAAVSDQQYTAYRWLSEAWRALVADDLVAASSAVDRATSASPIFTAVGGALAARASLWRRNVGAAAAALRTIELSGERRMAVDADRITIQAGIAALEGDPGGATALYREALARWRDGGLAWDEALCGLDMAMLLDPAAPQIRAAAVAARETFVRLRAAPFIERLDVATQGRPSASSPAPTRSRDLSNV